MYVVCAQGLALFDWVEMLKRRDLLSEAPNAKILDWLPVSPLKIDLGMLLIMPTMLPESQSKTRISFLPAPPANRRSCLALNEQV